MTLPICVDITLDQSKTDFEFDVECSHFQFDFSSETSIIINQTTAEIYTGDYVVEPKANDPIMLETKDKLCTDDILVLKVPRYSTSNDYGTTFYIGER